MKPPSPRFTLGGERDVRHLAQVDRRVADVGNHDAAQVVEAHGPADVPDEVLAGVLVSEPTAGVGAELGEGRLKLCVGDAERSHGRHVRADPKLTHLAADGDDLSDAREWSAGAAAG